MQTNKQSAAWRSCINGIPSAALLCVSVCSCERASMHLFCVWKTARRHGRSRAGRWLWPVISGMRRGAAGCCRVTGDDRLTGQTTRRPQAAALTSCGGTVALRGEWCVVCSSCACVVQLLVTVESGFMHMSRMKTCTITLNESVLISSPWISWCLFSFWPKPKSCFHYL